MLLTLCLFYCYVSVIAGIKAIERFKSNGNGIFVTIRGRLAMLYVIYRYRGLNG